MFNNRVREYNKELWKNRVNIKSSPMLWHFLWNENGIIFNAVSHCWSSFNWLYILLPMIQQAVTTPIKSIQAVCIIHHQKF